MTIIAGQSVFDGRDRTAQQQMSAIRDEIERFTEWSYRLI